MAAIRLGHVIIISCVFPRFNVRFASAAHDDACASSDCMVEALEVGTIRYPSFITVYHRAWTGCASELVTGND